MDKINNFNTTSSEIGEVKTDISHIYSLLKNNQGGSTTPGGDGSNNDSEINAIIEEKADTIRFMDYADIVEKKIDLIEGIRYKAVNGCIKLPHIMYFHHIVADDTRNETRTFTFHVDCLLASDAPSEEVVISALSNNRTNYKEYQNFDFVIEKTGTICSFDFAFTDLHYRWADSACPIVLIIKSKSKNNIKCYVAKVKGPDQTYGCFADKPNYLCKCLAMENPNKGYVDDTFPTALPYTTLMFCASETVGYTSKVKVKDNVDIKKVESLLYKDVFETDIVTNQYEYMFEVDFPKVNVKDISIGKPGNMDSRYIGGDSRFPTFFYLTHEGHVMYKVYDVKNKCFYEGQFCDGVYDSISFYGEPDRRPKPSETPCYLYLKEADNGAAKFGSDKIIMYRFGNDFFRDTPIQLVRQEFSLNELGFSGYKPLYVEAIYAKDNYIGFNVEAYDKDYHRKNVFIRVIYNPETKQNVILTQNFDNRCQAQGTGINYTVYMGKEIENNRTYFYVCAKPTDTQFINRRNVSEVKVRHSSFPNIYTPINTSVCFAAEYSQVTGKLSFWISMPVGIPPLN